MFFTAINQMTKGRGRPGALVAMFKQLDTLGGVDPRYGYTLLYSDNKPVSYTHLASAC